MVSDESVNQVLSGLASPDASRRDEWSEAVVDMVRALSAEQADQIGRALAHAALAESVAGAREAELTALNELTAWHDIDRTTVSSVLAIDAAGLGLSEQEALDDLRAYCTGD